MNKIVFAGKNVRGERLQKYLEITVKDGEVSVVPPYCDCEGKSSDEDLRIFIEQPVLPLKEAVIFNDCEEIRQAAFQAEKFFGHERGNAVMQALGNLLVSYICFYAERTSRSPVVELIAEDIAKNLSNTAYALDDFIKRLPLNYDYVRKLFQKETGATPRAYLENARMELAASILSSGVSNKYSNYSVSQVAEACGYAEPLYFSRVFKKHFGVAPSEYQG
ncbi:MAG: helix-turn-helix transcriptional regulator [Clostridia bacterium]|nr:helix-turn-helix transcriptional regulator [Clostridia bacterium]